MTQRTEGSTTLSSVLVCPQRYLPESRSQPEDHLLRPIEFFQAHIRAWQEAIQCRMLPSSEETDGNALMVMQRADQEVMKEEVLKLQLWEAKAR